MQGLKFSMAFRLGQITNNHIHHIISNPISPLTELF